jgi:mannose-1-phosphate guanylyltransferase
MANLDYIVIMAGGIGSRFWPLSSINYPKQFLDILGCGQTLIQQTFGRFLKMLPAERIYIVTTSDYVQLVKEQLPLLPKENIIAEPQRKNTAPCIAYTCFKLQEENPDATLLISPADHQVMDEDAFINVCNRAVDFTEYNDALVTLGISPTHPSTGYGYIQRHTTAIKEFVFPVKQYIEKPYLELAKSFLKNEDFLWNSGIFIWKIKDVLNAYSCYLPKLYSLFNNIKAELNTAGEPDAVREVYAQCQEISIDYGIMEKSDKVFIIPSSFEWSDLGTWNSAWENMPKDYQYNAITGNNVMISDSSRCIVHTPPGKIVIIHGLADYIVADTAEGLLIYPKDKEQEIKTEFDSIRKPQEFPTKVIV